MPLVPLTPQLLQAAGDNASHFLHDLPAPAGGNPSPAGHTVGGQTGGSKRKRSRKSRRATKRRGSKKRRGRKSRRTRR